ncbi:MAG: hypothetical protein NTZ05_09215 [Chloroflexi bacterium]|nr:hypothetical protein [Chloroflexota bacterium]
MKQLPVLLGAVAVVVVVGWIGFLVYAEQPGAGAMEEDHEEHAALMAQAPNADNSQVKLAVTIDPKEGATPADQVTMSAKLVTTAGAPVSNVQFEIVHWHLEDSKIVFATKVVSPDGVFEWQSDFYDGVPHEIRVKASPVPNSSLQFASIDVAPVVMLEALAPPLRVKVQGTIYLMAVIGIGAVLGLFITLRRSAVAPMKRPVRQRA